MEEKHLFKQSHFPNENPFLLDDFPNREQIKPPGNFFRLFRKYFKKFPKRCQENSHHNRKC